ncbi:MAG: hypothetical protein BIFFINMI_00034 [Phycisphaerae bacterium]|nr:hypothetical protein [Phycisphaerae bacterium]
MTRTWRYRRAARGQAFRHGVVFTLGGGAYIAVCFLVGLAAANSQINLLFLIFGIVLGGLVISGVLSRITLGGLRVTRRLPLAAMAGTAIPITYRLVNRKRRLTSYSLHVREYRPPAPTTESYLPAIPGRSTQMQRAAIVCRRRGVYRLDAMTVFTRFPFSLFVHFARFKDHAELIVYPAIGRLAHDITTIAVRTGAAAYRPLDRRGGDEEFFGLREYRAGDNPKRIHWRRSARLGTPLVREMSPPMPRRFMVIVSAQPLHEAEMTRGPDGEDVLLEQALSLAATLVHDAMNQAFDVGLVVADGPDHWIPASRGPGQRYAMMRALAVMGGRAATPLTQLGRRATRHMAGAQCIWITRGLGRQEVERQCEALAAVNIAVSPMRAEDLNFARLLRLGPGAAAAAGTSGNGPRPRAASAVQ